MKKIQSLERAMNILELIDSLGGEDGLGAIAVAQRAGLKVPTAHNFLQTFLALGYLEQTEHCKYRIAAKARWLGWDGNMKTALIQTARPHVVRLSAELDETVLLAACSGRWWQMLLQYESQRSLIARAGLPTTDNFYISATGRCILSTLPEAKLRTYVMEFRLPEADEWPGIDTFEQLTAALATIQHNHYELYRNMAGDLVGIGVPIAPAANRAAGALGVTIPASRFDAALQERVLKHTLLAAAAIH